jgi:hypothetical protein
MQENGDLEGGKGASRLRMGGRRAVAGFLKIWAGEGAGLGVLKQKYKLMVDILFR